MPSSIPTPVIIAGEVIVGEFESAWPALAGESRLHSFRQAEVQDLHCPVRTHLDVRRFQIAVDDPLLVRRFEGLGDLPRDRQRFVQRNGTFSDAVSQRRPFHQLHDQRDGAVRLFEPVNVGDVRMVQGREDFRFTSKSGEPLGISGERGRQHLDGNLALEVRVSGAIHLAHAAGAEQGDDLVGAEASAGGECHWVGGSIAGLSRPTSQQLARSRQQTAVVPCL